MLQLLASLPDWVPLAAATLGLAVACAALLYARWAMALANDRLEAAHEAQQRLLRIIEKHPEILDLANNLERPSTRPTSPPQESYSDTFEAQELLRAGARK